MTKKGGEVRELQDKLNSTEPEQKLEAIRRIIDAMTRGKDVSMLFMDVIKNMETTSLQLKKLIYLYIMSYAKAHPDLAILGVSTFRKVLGLQPRTQSTNPIPSSGPSPFAPWAASGSRRSLSTSATPSKRH